MSTFVLLDLSVMSSPSSVKSSRRRDSITADDDSIVILESPQTSSHPLRSSSAPPPPALALSSETIDLTTDESTTKIVDLTSPSPIKKSILSSADAVASDTAIVTSKKRSRQSRKSSEPEQPSLPPPTLFSHYSCPICFCPPTPIVTTSCGHVFCGSCIHEALKSQERSSSDMPDLDGKCPVCRTELRGGWGKSLRGIVTRLGVYDTETQ